MTLFVENGLKGRGLLIDEVSIIVIIEVGYGVDAMLLDGIINDVIVEGGLLIGVDIALGRTRLLINEAIDEFRIVVELLISANVVLGRPSLLVDEIIDDDTIELWTRVDEVRLLLNDDD